MSSGPVGVVAMKWVRRVAWWRLVLVAAGLAAAAWAVRRGEAPPIAAVAFAPDGRTLATMSYGRWVDPPRARAEVRTWDLATGDEHRADRRVLDDLALVVEGGDRLVARGAGGRTIPLADLASWPLRTLLTGLAGGPLACAAVASPDGRRLATARHWANRDDVTTVRVWDVTTGRLVRELDPAGRVDMLAWSADGRTLVGAGGAFSAWDVESGAALGWARGAPRCVSPVATAPAGGMLAVQGLGLKLTCLDATDGRAGPVFPFLQADALAFAPDGGRLAVADDVGGHPLVTVYDLGSARPVARFRGHERPHRRVEAARMWANQALGGFELRTGVNLWPLARGVVDLLADVVCSMTFSPDGRWVASGDSDGAAIVWDAATGAERARFDHGDASGRGPRATALALAAAASLLACRPRRRRGRAVATGSDKSTGEFLDSGRSAGDT